MRLRLSSLVMSLWLVACGGDQLTSDGIPASTARPLCERSCARSVDCNGGGSLDTCVNDCVDDVADKLRGDAMQAFVDCVEDLDCKDDEAECLPTCQPLDAHVEFEARCRATLTACFAADDVDRMCEVTPGTRFDDSALTCLFAPSIVEQMTACFDGEPSCDPAFDCLEGVLDAHGLD